MGGHFPAWAVVFLRGPSFSCVGDRLVRGPSFWCVGDRFGAWAIVFMHGRPVSCVGDCFGAWATILVRGQPCSCVTVVSVRGRSFPCMGGRLDAEVVVGVGGVVVARGVVVLWFSWNHSGRVGGAYHVEEQRRTTNFHSLFVVRLPRHRQ